MPLTDVSKRLGHVIRASRQRFMRTRCPGRDDLAAAWEKFQKNAKPAKPARALKARSSR